ncbi:helix-turn-helix domain-containing protein [Hymenobacter sp. HMF4947]|uniref:Helix-turn-helix domain-containing protein n=1 Tax=Hymenobacter ginkgonis TaxID=2682976 RepID=A0A7K1TH15_9BACT|nr:helix-turn-helix transcriptional regulator [Hymenobacter ginkgonis]MVN77716.1 helix-turn-helix domain-containing protein [Hymenobacter ginkgonis]
MSETTINQRLNFLLKELGMKAGSFARALELSETTVRNYIDRTAKPSSEVLEKISNTFRQVNLVWLITGREEPFISDDEGSVTQTNISGDRNNVASGKNGKAIQKNDGLSDCEKERDILKAQLDKTQQQVEHLQAQLATKDALIASKEETIDLLKAAFNRPNT